MSLEGCAHGPTWLTGGALNCEKCVAEQETSIVTVVEMAKEIRRLEKQHGSVIEIPKRAPLQEEYRAELKRLEFEGFEIHLILKPIDIVALIGNIQLALRHPGNNGPTSKLAREIKDTLISHIAKRYPTMASFLRCGDNPAFDE